MEKVSIIVPVYNVEPYLSRCLDSLLAQQYDHKEIVVVNDGSTDQSLVILREYQKRYPEIVVIDQENQGLSEARNAGLRASSGNYILFVDSDDFLLPGSIQALVEAMEPQIDIVELPIFDTYDTHQHPSGYQTPTTINGIDLQEHPSALFHIAVYAWAKLYRRSLIEDLSFPKGLMHEDNYVATCLMPRLRHVHKVDQGGYCYYQRQTSITAAFNTNMYDMIAVQRAIYTTYEAKGYLDQYRLLCEKMAIRNLCVAILGKKMAKIKPELRSTRKEAYDSIVLLMKECYPQWRDNPYVTSKESLFVSCLLSNYLLTRLIWKGVEWRNA